MDSIQGLQVMTLANSIIGVSILAMPYCFKQCGIILSIVLLLFSSVLSRLSCHFLIKSAIKAKLKTFENLAFHAFGPLGKFVVEIGLIGFLIGTCIAFFVVMGDLGPQIVAQLSETTATSQLRTIILISLALFCVLPLGLLRNVESLSGVCTATIGFYACLVLKIISESAPHIASGDWIENVDFWRPSGILQCIPIFSMALFCQTQLFEIYQTMPNASLDKMNAVVRIATHICTCVYVFVGVFGYIAVSAHGAPFGGNILLAFRPSLITEIIKIGFVLSVAFSFPLVIFPCRASIYSLLYKSSYSLLDNTHSINGSTMNLSHTSSSMASPPTFYIPDNKFRTITILVVATSLLIGIIIPNIELVLGLVGSTIGVMICVIFPATSFICLTTKNTNERIGAQIMLCIGVLVMVLGSYANFYAIEEVAINPMDSVKPIQIENVPVIENAINLMDEKHKDQVSELDVEKVINEIKLDEINNNVPKDKVVDEVDKINEPNQDVLNEVRHEPVQPEEPIEEPKKEVSAAKIETAEKPVKNITIEKGEDDVVLPKQQEEKTKSDTNIDVEAIRKEDAEVLEQRKKDILLESKKNEEILENLQKQNEIQQELVEEQKKILGELKELKKITLEEKNKNDVEKGEGGGQMKSAEEVVLNENVKKRENSQIMVNEAAEEMNPLRKEEILKNNDDKSVVGVVKDIGANENIEIKMLLPSNIAEQKFVEHSDEKPLKSQEPIIKDTVLKLLENQMDANKRENLSEALLLQLQEEGKIDSVKNTNEKINNNEDGKENNINSMRRDILSANQVEEVRRVKRDAFIGQSDESELPSEEEQCNNDASKVVIVKKDEQSRNEGKFVARELKSVQTENDT